MDQRQTTIEEMEAKLLYDLNLLNELIRRSLGYKVHQKTKILEIERLMDRAKLMISAHKAKTAYPLLNQLKK